MRTRKSLVAIAVFILTPVMTGLGCSDKSNDGSPGAMAGTASLPTAGASGISGAGASAAGSGGAPVAGTASIGTGGTSAGAGAGGAGATTGGDTGSGGSTPELDGGLIDSGLPAGNECTRDFLSALVDQYFEALSANDASALPIAASAKITENGAAIELSEGLWANAGSVSFKMSALDTETCSAVTEAVVEDGSTAIPVGVRLKVDGGEIVEIETIAARSGDYFVASDTDLIIESANADWLSMATVAEAERSTRQELMQIVDDYFTRFPAGGCNFAGDCVRLENGFSPGACSLGLSCSTSGSMGMQPSRHVIDVEAGIAVGFVMFAGSYTDFHMFKVYAGEVHGVHAVLAGADQSGWD